jgi:palmitoyltransferase
MSHTLFIFLIIMCFILGITLLIFVLYHFYLISQNMTSNERAKSSDYISELKTIIKNQNKMLQ